MSEALVDGPTLRPLGRDWTYADLDALPGDTRGYEIVEGSLVVPPTPSRPHQFAAYWLCRLLADAAPPDVVVLPDVDVDLGRNVFEPDVVVLRADAYAREGPLRAIDLVLAVEVTSPSSRSMDRIIKPAALAAAGVPNYWRVDLEAEPFVEIYELDAAAYTLTATARVGGALKVEQPFEVEIDAAQLVR